MNFVIMWFTQLENKTAKSYAGYCNTKFWKVAHIYDKLTLSKFFIGNVDSSIYCSLSQSWETHSHANVTYIVHKAQNFLAIHEGKVKQATWRNRAAATKLFFTRNWNKHAASAVIARLLFLSETFPSPQAIAKWIRITTRLAFKPHICSLKRTQAPLSSLMFPSPAIHGYETCLDRSHRTLGCPMFCLTRTTTFLSYVAIRFMGTTTARSHNLVLLRVLKMAITGALSIADNRRNLWAKVLVFNSPHATPRLWQKAKDRKKGLGTLVTDNFGPVFWRSKTTDFQHD